MAKFNEILTGRYNRFLQKLLQMKGGPPAAQLATEITPGFSVERLPVELRTLMAVDRFYGGQSVPAVAAQDAAFQITNPAGSGTIAIIEVLILTTGGTASTFNVSTSDAVVAALTNLQSPTRVDSRGNPRSPLTLSTQNNIGADLATGVGFLQLGTFGLVNLISEENQEITLAPGRTLRIRNSTVNATLTTWLIYRQRSLEDSELTA